MTNKTELMQEFESEYSQCKGIEEYTFSRVEDFYLLQDTQTAWELFELKANLTQERASLFAESQAKQALQQENEQLESEIESTKKAQQWMPIETAPKNKWILVCQSRNGIISTACGTDEYGNWKTGSSIMSYIAEVTHWMPLPTAPEY